MGALSLFSVFIVLLNILLMYLETIHNFKLSYLTMGKTSLDCENSQINSDCEIKIL